MIIKICGLKTVPEALAAAEAGADMIGLNFYPRSARYIDETAAREICSGVPRGICKVGVFVNEPTEKILETAQKCGLDAAQLHGDVSPEQIAHLSGLTALTVIRAFNISAEEDLAQLGRVEADYILLDSRVKGLHGGTGRSFDWSLAVKARDHTRSGIILAGGLRPDNVAEAIRRGRPDGVDVAGGVETAPGVKSIELIEEFIRAARGART